jgi:GT2 family glycosyltransferase
MSTATANARKPGVIVGFASAGRPAILSETVTELQSQTLQPSRIIVSVPAGADAAEVDPGQANLSIITGMRGLTAQRNMILRAAMADAGKDDILVFFDDDFYPERHYLAELCDLFQQCPNIVMSTGLVLADGIGGPGLSPADARTVLGSAAQPDAMARARIHDVYNAYGCNMVVRVQTLRQTGALFDERLPLYGWLEDVDFSRAVASAGRIVRFDATMGVHLGVKSGRQSGLRLGYSQIANPVYLMAKHRCARSKALHLMARNVTMNALKSLRPEPFIDRGGRLSGNLKAFADLLKGELRPEKAAQL